MSAAVNDKGSLTFKDRKTGLVVFGIFEILGGVFTTLIAGVMLVMMLSAKDTGKLTGNAVDASAFLPAVLMYVSLSVWNFWMGIGSIKVRRWARTLLLISSWVWLVSGVVAISFFMQNPGVSASEAQQVPPQAQHIFKIVTLVFMAIFYIVIPGVMVMFYGSRHVKATCEQWDPVIRWTDKCPLPVLGLSLLWGVGLLGMPLSIISGYTIPVFGVVLSGAAGAVFMLINGLVIAYMAWGMYKLKVQAWWCAGARQHSLTPTGVRRQETGVRSWKSSTYAELDKIIHVPVLATP